jgi:serine/threonine protein kinase
MIIKGNTPSLPEFPWSAEFKAFVNACLEKDPKKRPTIE